MASPCSKFGRFLNDIVLEVNARVDEVWRIG